MNLSCQPLEKLMKCLFFLFRPSGSSKALKLGAKGKEVDNFVDKLKSEGETIMPSTGKRGSDVSKALPPPVNMERYRPGLYV